METSKPGKHGTLHLFEIAYTDKPERDDGQPYYNGTSRVWAYDADHAVEKFYDGEDDSGWRATSIKRVSASPSAMRRAPEIAL